MFLAGLVSTIGDRVHLVALAALILGLTDSMSDAGLVFVVSTLPYLLFGLVAGVLVDRLDRRWTLVGADLVRAALVAAIPGAALLSLPLVYVLLFAVMSATVLFRPAQQAILPDLVASDELSSANGLLQAAAYTADLIGYPLAAGLIGILLGRLGSRTGMQLAFGLDAVSYVVSAWLLWRLRVRPQSRAAVRLGLGGVPGHVVEGLRFLFGRSQLRAIALLLTIGPLLLGAMHTLWVGFAWRISHTDALGFGITELCNALGTLAGLGVLSRLGRRLNKGQVILVGFGLMAAAMAGVGLTDSLALAALLAALGGAGNMLLIVPSLTLLQQQTPGELRGRVFAVRAMLTYTAFSISNAAAGAWSDALGVGPLLVLLGGAGLLAATLASLVPTIRRAE